MRVRLQLQRFKWFLHQVRVVWRISRNLGLDGNWPTLLLKPYSKGDWVQDDLTRTKTTVLGVEYAEGFTNPGCYVNPDQMGCWGIYVNSSHFDGARHPWEISPLC